MPADREQFPWQTIIQSSFTEGGGLSFCGGSLISELWTLTAAHCTEGRSFFEVGMGSIFLSEMTHLIRGKRVINHPDYNPFILNNDVSVVELSEPAVLGPSIQIVRLVALSQLDTSFVNERTRVSGFGLTRDGGAISNALYWFEANPISNSDCENVYGPDIVINSTMCAFGWNNQNESICNGDSGGAMVINENGKWTQIGVISFISSSGCQTDNPQGFARMTHFVEWISKNTDVPVRP